MFFNQVQKNKKNYFPAGLHKNDLIFCNIYMIYPMVFRLLWKLGYVSPTKKKSKHGEIAARNLPSDDATQLAFGFGPRLQPSIFRGKFPPEVEHFAPFQSYQVTSPIGSLGKSSNHPPFCRWGEPLDFRGVNRCWHFLSRGFSELPVVGYGFVPQKVDMAHLKISHKKKNIDTQTESCNSLDTFAEIKPWQFHLKEAIEVRYLPR